MPTPTQQEEYLLRYANYRVEQEGVDGFGFFWDEYNKTTPAYWTRQILLDDDWINHSYFAYDNSNGFTPIQNFGTGRKHDETNNFFYVAQGILRGDITSVDSTHYRVNVNNITYIPNVYYEYMTSSPSNYAYADAFSIVYSSSEYRTIYSGYSRNYTPPTSFEQTYNSREEALQNLVTIFHNIEIWVDGERWAHARVYTSGGGAGSGYIGNSLLSNKKMVGYDVPTSSAEGTKTESVNEASASAVSGKPKSGNGFARIKYLREAWGGEEVPILWAGNSNKMTVQISNSSILFKLYTGDSVIYSFTAYAGSMIYDADNIYVGFLIDTSLELAKPSMIYDNNSVLSYNQEEPTEAQMDDIYTWISPGLPSE